MIKAAINPADPLTGILDEYLIKRGDREPPPLPEKSRPRRGGRFTPSGMKCQRAAAFQFMRVPGQRLIDPETQITFGVGNWLHKMWQAYFKDMERVLGPDVIRFIDYEQWCTVPKFYLGGNCDIHVHIRGTPAIIDIKTIKDSGFTQLMMTGKPDPEHVKQLTRYLRALDVKLGLLLYQNKNDPRTKIFVVNFRKSLWLESVRWLKEAGGYLARREVPPMCEDCTADSTMRKQCAWQSICYGDPDLDIQALLYSGKPTHQELWEETSA